MMNKPQLPKGHTSILSPTFRYVPAANTDLSRTFARIREQRLAQVRTGASVSDPEAKKRGLGGQCSASGEASHRRPGQRKSDR